MVVALASLDGRSGQTPQEIVERLAADEEMVVSVAALPDLWARLQSRAPRIARAAMVELQTSAEVGERAASAIVHRAAVEKALVARGQLIASFVGDIDTVPAELDGSWSSSYGLLNEEMRAELERRELDWLEA